MATQVTKTLFRLSCDDPHKRQGFGDWIIGDAFAFYTGDDTSEATPRVQYLGDKKFGLGDSKHFGHCVTADPIPWRAPKLEAVITDRDLYREGNDTIRVVVFAPGARSASVVLTLNGQSFATLQIDTDVNGLGLYELPDPLAGEYEAKLGESSTQFTVAGFKLAPLTAQLASSQLSRDGGKELLAFALGLETYGSPFGGRLSVAAMDLGHSPPRQVSKVEVFAKDGQAAGELPLQGEGPFALQLQAADDAMKTATVPLPGSRQSERKLMTLAEWGSERHVASLLPFDGAAARRGIYVGKEATRKSASPVAILERQGDTVKLKARSELEAFSVVVLDPWSAQHQVHTWGHVEAGDVLEVFVSASSPWSLLLAGAQYMGKCWEGRAALIESSQKPLTVQAPERCEPGQIVTLQIQGPAGATAFVLVKDARLQTADTPTSATAASLRRQIEKGLGLLSDRDVTTTLDSLIPIPPPPMPPPAPAPGGVWRGGGPVMAPMMMAGGAPPPVMAAAPMAFAPQNMQRERRQEVESSVMFGGDLDGMLLDRMSSEGAEMGGEGAPPPKARQHFPEVMVAKLITLDPTGAGEISVKMGEAMGLMRVEVFGAMGSEWDAATTQIQVTREVFGELVLPCFVRLGDYAEGRLFVSSSGGPVMVQVKRDGKPVALVSAQGEGERLNLAAPGGTVAFAAEPGAYVAEVTGATASDRAQGKVEQPGKLVWLQKALRMLLPGESVSMDEPNVLSLRVLPSLDDTFDQMVGGLRSYEHCCCEQTSAVLLAAAAAYLTAKDDDTKNKAANHIRACVTRERSMYLPGRGFKGWPEYAPEVFCYSPGATLNLLQMEMFTDLPMSKELKAAVDDCLLMARDAAKAHRIDTAPEHPKSAREAYGRFGKFLDDRQRMAAFIRERVEPWKQEMKAILKFELPALTTETYHKNDAMIRAETAFGAAALIEAGGVHLEDGLRLANTVMSAVQENGSLYSTLDSVAAITLLTSMKRAGVGPGGDAQCELNGEPSIVADALKCPQIQSLRALKQPLQVEVQRLVEEDYTAINQGVKADISLKRQTKDLGREPSLTAGDAVDLTIKLKSGYEAGDLLHVFLPDALSWVQGGGQIKKFSLDFKGQAELSVPLAATGLTLDAQGNISPQHFAICIRNMYDEARGFGTDQLSVRVSPPGSNAPSSGLGQRIMQGLRGLFKR